MIDCGRIYLKQMREKDIPQAIELLKSNSAKMLNDDFGENLNPETMQNMFHTKIRDEQEKELIFLAYLKKSKKLIGYFSVSQIDWMKGSADVSVFIEDNYQAMGYGFIGISGLTNFCFEELNFNRICSKIKDDNYNLPNRASGQLYRKIPKGDGKYTSYYYWEHLKQ